MNSRTSKRDDDRVALSHYEDHVAFFHGKMSAAIASLVSYFLTAEFVFLATTIGMLSIILSDMGNIREHKQLMQSKSPKLDEWRKGYRFLSTAFMFLTGIWCFFCFFLSDNTFLHLLCIATSLGNIINLICRNFVDDKALTMQLLAVGIPMVFGVLSYGDYRSLILCGFFLPLFSNLREVSRRLKNMFANVAEESEQREAFGFQLNEALESMSHGVLMFDDDMRLRVMNRTARHILNINEAVDWNGRRLDGIANAIDLQHPVINRVRVLEEALLKRLQRKTHSKIFQISEQQYVELSIKLRDNGGCVLVIDDVSQRIQYQNRINELARFDDLTGLCNRNYFHQQVETRISKLGPEKKAIMLFFDLDDFKRINDMVGHEAGDFILTNVAMRVREFMPKDAIIGRYGGDEFVVFVDEDFCMGQVGNMADQLIAHITQPAEYNQQTLRFGSSIGIARFPEDARGIDRLLKLADLALYESKKAGKNTKTFFTADLEDELHDRVQMEQDLTQAVRDGSLELHFQPIIDVKSQKPALFEALTRWTRNGNEVVSPAVFVPLAEDLGLIREIGEWTIFEACRRCKTWPENTSVAVNVSAVQFQVGSIADVVRNALVATGIAPHRLEIEITETAVLNDMTHAVMVLEEISSLGVKISLDDFGTGYSSLSYLHRLPLHKIKIDKSFVDDIVESPRSQTLLKGIAAMGKALGLKLVVEGIESQTQFELLRGQYPIDYVQGFYFSKPLPARAAQEFAMRFNGQNPQKAELQTANQAKVA